MPLQLRRYGRPAGTASGLSVTLKRHPRRCLEGKLAPAAAIEASAHVAFPQTILITTDSPGGRNGSESDQRTFRAGDLRARTDGADSADSLG
eukprot:266712-Chlamydomonas_euryale.AAC.2